MTKQELPRLFIHLSEIETRKPFSSSTTVTLDNFKSLIGPYRFGNDVKCQLLKSDGNCGHKHRNGWLGVTKDGSEGLIGGDCAAKYFAANKDFATERRRINAEISISNSLEILSRILSDRQSFENDVQLALRRLRGVKEDVRSLCESLGPDVVKILSDMAKTGNDAVYVQVQYIEQDENGREEIDWVDVPVGKVTGTAVCLYTNIGEIFAGLKAIQSTLVKVELRRDAGERKLKHWSKILSSLVDWNVKIDALAREFKQFSKPKNLALLVFLIANNNQQATIAQIALEKDNVQNPSNEDGRKLINRLSDQIRTANGNRNFRVAR